WPGGRPGRAAVVHRAAVVSQGAADSRASRGKGRQSRGGQSSDRPHGKTVYWRQAGAAGFGLRGGGSRQKGRIDGGIAAGQSQGYSQRRGGCAQSRNLGKNDGTQPRAGALLPGGKSFAAWERDNRPACRGRGQAAGRG